MFYSAHTLRITAMYVMWRMLEVIMYVDFVHEHDDSCVK